MQNSSESLLKCHQVPSFQMVATPSHSSFGPTAAASFALSCAQELPLVFIQNRQSGRSNYYGSTLGSHSKIPAESRCYSAPPKPAIKLNSGSWAESCAVLWQEVKTEVWPATYKHQKLKDAVLSADLGRIRELTPENLEKKRLQTIAAYQFMTPADVCRTREVVLMHLGSVAVKMGQTFYYCTRENVKQHLRSIYLAHQPGQKPPKSALQTNWPPVCCQERHRTLRCIVVNPGAFLTVPSMALKPSEWWNHTLRPGASEGLRTQLGNQIFPGGRNPLTGATSEFLGDASSLRTSPMPHGMMELAHNVSKLALVSKKMREHQENSTKRRAANRSHVQPQPTTEKPIRSAEELQLSSAMEGKESKEGQAVEQGFGVNTLPQGSGIKTLQALKAVQEIIDKRRGASGRDHTVIALKKKRGTGNSQALKNIVGLSFSKDLADRKDTAEDLLNLPQSGNCQDTGVAHDSKDSAIIIPMLDCPLTPDESTDMELLPNVQSSNSKLAESLAGEKGQASHPRTVRPSDLSFTSLWEKPSGVPKHCISMEKGRCSTHSLLSGTLQGPLDPENGKDVFCSMDSLSVPFPRKCLGTEVLFSLSDDDDE
ncbi:unnamed protein product [Lepidochelys olivacea]